MKKIFIFLTALIVACCIGVVVCAMNPSLTAKLAEQVKNLTSKQSGGQQESTESPESQSGAVSRLLDEILPNISFQGIGVTWPEGVDTGWVRERVQTGYEAPDSRSVEPPETVSGRNGLKPVRDEVEQIPQEEAAALVEDVPVGNTGDGLNFDGKFYPYYGMLEEDMRSLYRQIYANAMELAQSFAPVIPVNVRQLKTVFEAVYNDHPELFWLETGYSCKYLRSGRCVEVTLQYNETAENLDAAREAFGARAVQILQAAAVLDSDPEKEQLVHDRLMQSVEYVLDAPMNQSAYSALVEGRTVCAGYARAFQYLMMQLGIPCYYSTGFAGQDHAWNIVKIGTDYHNVDVTWDDTDPSTYDYYNKSDQDFSGTHVRTGLSVYLPACVSGPEALVAPSSEEPAGNAETLSGISAKDLVNQNPVEPLRWPESATEEPSVPEESPEPSAAPAGAIDTMEAYYEDCGKLLREVGAGDRQFTNVISNDLWDAVEQAYSSGAYKNGYVEAALKELGVENFVIHLQIQDLGDGSRRLYHNVYTY